MQSFRPALPQVGQVSGTTWQAVSPDLGTAQPLAIQAEPAPITGPRALRFGDHVIRTGLIVRSPWVEFILEGQKKWEIRGTATAKRGWIALIRGGSKTIVGACRLVDVVGPLTHERWLETVEEHQTPEDELRQGLPYPRTFAWVLADVFAFSTPIPYCHPSGAVIWVSFSGAETPIEGTPAEASADPCPRPPESRRF
jgi:hypothetical protein